MRLKPRSFEAAVRAGCWPPVVEVVEEAGASVASSIFLPSLIRPSRRAAAHVAPALTQDARRVAILVALCHASAY